MWPKYCSFSFATLPINSLYRPNSVNIESFVRCSCQKMLSIFLRHHISKASIRFLSDFFKVHPSTPYWNTAHTTDFITLIFVAVFIFRSFQILKKTKKNTFNGTPVSVSLPKFCIKTASPGKISLKSGN